MIMGRDLQRLEVALPLGSVEAYISWANQIPLLSITEEHELATRFRQNSDLDAARRLILAHLRLVISIARTYAGYGLPHADLIQEGNIGLMKAVKRFNPEVGVRLVSFAIHWIKAEIHEFILRNWRIVKMATTKAQRKLFFNLRKATQRLGWLNEEKTKQVAAELKVKAKDVRRMETCLYNSDESYDGFTSDDNLSPAQYLEDNRYDPARQLEASNWAEDQGGRLHQALINLDDRSQDILQKRWMREPKATLQELAMQYGISAERVRQLEKLALTKLKLVLTN